MTSAVEQPPVRCLRPGCGRKLTAPASIARRYGRTCYARIRKAATGQALTGFTEDQHAKALELIADGGIVPTSRPGVYAAASSDGSTFYVVNLTGPVASCTCAAGLHGRACYHLAAARILQAAAATTRKAA